MKKQAKALVQHPTGIIGIILVLFWVSVAILAPMLAPPQDPDNAYMMVRHGFSSLPNPPNGQSPWGTTSGGYDIFYGIIWGSRTALVLGLVTVLATATIGALAGGVCAYYGGILDGVCMRIVDLFMGIPFLIAVIVMTTVWGKGMDKIILALIVFGWHRYARMMRSEVLVVKEQEFVLAAKNMGASPMGIFFRHVLPNALSPIIILMSINIGRMVLVAASLSFVGIGAEPGFADWGQMLNFSRNWISGIPGAPFYYWYTYAYASVAIFTFVLGWTLLGDALGTMYGKQEAY
ncbi:MAG: ABC transporter permease [Desulfobacterium sp.]|nr:ABC transporter permease [Desulfobacterium sp.]